MKELRDFPGFSIVFDAPNDSPTAAADLGKSETVGTGKKVSYADALRAAFAFIFKGKSVQVDMVDGKPVATEIPLRPAKK